MPGAGKDYGFVWMPEVNDEVLVAFEAGDASRPYIVGGLWNGVDTIPFEKGKDLDAGKVITRSIISRTKHKITFRESSQEASIELATSGGAVTITLDEQNKVFKVAVTGGKVQIQADTDVEIKAGGSMKLEATGQMTIKGATVAHQLRGRGPMATAPRDGRQDPGPVRDPPDPEPGLGRAAAAARRCRSPRRCCRASSPP